jgi:hypothetical protein
MPRGFDRPLYILPFDHRGSFETKMFGWHEPLSSEQTADIAAAKRVIYDGFLAAVAGGVPRLRRGCVCTVAGAARVPRVPAGGVRWGHRRRGVRAVRGGQLP